MSFLDQFTFLGQPPTRTSADLGVQKAYPGIVLSGTEPGSIYSEVREVNGQLWLVINATYNGTGWQPIVATSPCYAIVVNYGNGSILTTLYTNSLPVATPINWYTAGKL